MVSILPSERTPFDVIGKDVGRALQGVLPGAVQQGYQRGQGLGAIDQLQEALGAAGGDINKILPALAKAYTMNPGLERSGLGQQYLQQARLGHAFGGQGGQGQQTQNQQPSVDQQATSQPNQMQGQQPQGEEEIFSENNTSGIIPTLKTQSEIQSEAQNWAQNLNDPAQYDVALNRLNAQNQQAQAQISKLENLAEEQGVSREDMPEFMQIGKNHNYMKDPNKWLLATKKDWTPYKNAKEQLSNAFVPGFWRGLVSSPEEREKSLNRLTNPVQTLLKLNPSLEGKIRNDLAGEYLSPTEIEAQIHPLAEKTKSGLDNLPKGVFPKFEVSFKGGYPEQKQNPFISYEKAVEKAPREMQVMNKRLVNFFKQNVNPDTSLLVLRDKLWNDKDYDWRQISDALQESTTGKDGIRLTPSQKAELTELQTQAPKQSLSNVFSDWGRWIDYIRGNK